MVWRCWSRIGEWDVARLGSRIKRGIKRLRGYDGVQVDHFASEPSEPPGPSDTPREDMLSYLRNRKEATPEAPLSLPLPPSCIARLFRYTAVLPGLKGNDRSPPRSRSCFSTQLHHDRKHQDPYTRLHSSEPLRCTRVPPKVGARRLNRKSALVANMNDRL